MRLSELLGYHKYEQMSFMDFYRDVFKKIGYAGGSGAFGFVLIPPSGDFVYKCWINDKGYDAFINLIKYHQDNPFFPKILSKLHRIPIFFKRPATIDGYLNVIKIEKFTHPVMNKVTYTLYKCISKTIDDVKSLSKEEIIEKIKISVKASDDDKEIKDKLDPEKLYDAAKVLVKALDDYKITTDLHGANMMMRGNQIVITDPFVHTEDWQEIRMASIEPDSNEIPNMLRTTEIKFGKSKSTPVKSTPSKKSS